MIEHTTDEFDETIKTSRKIAVTLRHGFIHIHHLFAAICTTPCLANRYCKTINANKWQAELATMFPADAVLTEEDNIPLTLESQAVLENALYYTEQSRQQHTNSIHLLLGLLSYNNTIKEEVKKTGIIFTDVVEDNFPTIFKKRQPQFIFPSIKPYSKLQQFFMSEKSRERKTNSIQNTASMQYAFEEYERCISSCKIGLSLYPTFEPLKAIIAACHIRKKDFGNAVKVLDALLTKLPEDLHYRISLAHVYSELGDLKKSNIILDELIHGGFADATVLNNKGFVLAKEGKYAEAVPYYEKAIELDASLAYPWDNLGFAKFKLGYKDEAFELIEKSLQLDRGNSYSYMYLGKMYRALKNEPEAIKNLDLALKYGFTKDYGDEVLEMLEEINN